MKRILIMRHAKSDWNTGSKRDFDRPLNGRGEESAPAVGVELKKKGLTPDLMISSPAMRAKMTAEAVAKTSGYKADIEWNESYYFGYTGEILASLKHLDESIQSVMIFGHNPTFSSFSEMLSGTYTELSTADVVIMNYDGLWEELDHGTCKQIMYISSRDLI
jgi:phosphohistidine phosphatase